jgi:hypothetical protein
MTRRATFLIFSGLATEVPPNFWTIKAIAFLSYLSGLILLKLAGNNGLPTRKSRPVQELNKGSKQRIFVTGNHENNQAKLKCKRITDIILK